jgi:hypothetical protein
MNFALAYVAYKIVKHREAKEAKKKAEEEKNSSETTSGDTSTEPQNAKSTKSEPRDLMESFHCPISQQLIEDPVSSKYGHIYEKTEIERWV